MLLCNFFIERFTHIFSTVTKYTTPVLYFQPTPSISDSIIGRRKVENQPKTKKVYKVETLN